MSPLAIRAQQTDCVADTQGPQCRTGDHYEVSLVADGKVGNRSGQHGIFRQCRFAGQHDGISVVWNCIQGGVTLTEQVLRRSSDSKKNFDVDWICYQTVESTNNAKDGVLDVNCVGGRRYRAAERRNDS